MQFTKQEKEALFAHFDLSRDGHISYEEFARGVRGGMNPRRRGIVRPAAQLRSHRGAELRRTCWKTERRTSDVTLCA